MCLVGNCGRKWTKLLKYYKKEMDKGSLLSFNAFLAAIAQCTRRWKWNMAALARFSILSLLAHTFRRFVFCFLQPSADPCNDFSSLEWSRTFFPPSLIQNYQIMLDIETGRSPVFCQVVTFYFPKFNLNLIWNHWVKYMSMLDLQVFFCSCHMCLVCVSVQSKTNHC